MIQKNTNSDFKYYAKLQEGKKTRYFYTKAEYDAYTKDANTSQDTSNKLSSDPYSIIKRHVARAYRIAVPKIVRRVITDQLINVASKIVDIGKSFIKNKLGIDLDNIDESKSKKGKAFVNQYSHTDLESFLKNNQKGYDALSKKKDSDSERIKNAIDNISSNPRRYKENVTLNSGNTVFKEFYYDKVNRVAITFDENDKINVSLKDSPENVNLTPFMSLNDDGTLNLEKDWFEKADTSEMEQSNIAERKREIDAYRASEPSFMKDIPKVKTIETYDEVMDNINEKLIVNAGYMNNCVFSSMAYEVRCRGYDVDVASLYEIIDTMEESGLSYTASRKYDKQKHEVVLESDYTKSIYENPETICVFNKMVSGMYLKNPVDTIESLYPPGTRGNISVRWENGGGHSMVFEMDKNNHMLIRDTQTHKTYSGMELDALLDRVNPASICTTRTDNLELKKGALYALRSN